MSSTHRKMDSEDRETLFHSYPCSYYAQSPSTISHQNSSELTKTHNLESTFHYSPSRSDTNIDLINKNPEVSRFTLSHYSSSHGSSNSNFLMNDQKKIINGINDEKGINRLIIVDHEQQSEEDLYGDDEYFYGRKGAGWWWRYCSFRRSSSCAWISLQISWRLLVSLGVALLVFYIATKPPPPKMSIKIAGIKQFGLGEGIDGSGVATKILTCNCSIHLLIENKSKLFGLHIQPSTLQMFFGRLPFAISHGSELYAESHCSSKFQLYVGTRNKPMYGAGRTMQDMLESSNGLPILISVSLSSYFRVVSNFIKPNYNHQAQCLLFLYNHYDKKNRITQAFNSTCTIS